MVVNAKILLIGGPFLLLFDSKGREASVALWLAGVGTKVFLFFSSAIAAVFAAPDNFWKQQPAEEDEGSCLA